MAKVDTSPSLVHILTLNTLLLEYSRIGHSWVGLGPHPCTLQVFLALFCMNFWPPHGPPMHHCQIVFWGHLECSVPPTKGLKLKLNLKIKVEEGSQKYWQLPQFWPEQVDSPLHNSFCGQLTQTVMLGHENPQNICTARQKCNFCAVTMCNYMVIACPPLSPNHDRETAVLGQFHCAWEDMVIKPSQ